jgi:hypothetical protein
MGTDIAANVSTCGLMGHSMARPIRAAGRQDENGNVTGVLETYT